MSVLLYSRIPEFLYISSPVSSTYNIPLGGSSHPFHMKSPSPLCLTDKCYPNKHHSPYPTTTTSIPPPTSHHNQSSTQSSPPSTHVSQNAIPIPSPTTTFPPSSPCLAQPPTHPSPGELLHAQVLNGKYCASIARRTQAEAGRWSLR